MSILKAQEGEFYTGYDNATDVEWCTPSVLGCGACIGATVNNNEITLSITLKSPFGNWTKTFTINGAINFTWSPVSRVKIVVSISNYGISNNSINFDLGGQVCIQLPFIGWKCIGYTHAFSVPIPFNENQLADILDDNQFATLLALHASGVLDESCKCNH